MQLLFIPYLYFTQFMFLLFLAADASNGFKRPQSKTKNRLEGLQSVTISFKEMMC